jgi:hypothetical protein
MRNIFTLFVLTLFTINSRCGGDAKRVVNNGVAKDVVPTEHSIPSPTPKIGKEMAISMARSDFAQIVKSPSKYYDAVATEEEMAWRVVFYTKPELGKTSRATYVIDKETGKFLEREFAQ